jgi:hypothetical protein
MKVFSNLLLLLALLAMSPVRAQDFPSAVEALGKGHDQEALAILRRLDQAGHSSFGSLYDEGLAFRNLGQTARARACFERALLLRPHSLATRRRLQELEGRLGPKVAELDVTGTPWWKANEVELLVVLPGLIMLGLALKARRKGRRPAETPMLVLFLGGVALLGLVMWNSPAPNRAVVVDQSAQLLPEPQPDKAGEALPAGVMVDVLEQQGHYLKARLGDGRSGWLRTAQTVELTLPSSEVKSAPKG